MNRKQSKILFISHQSDCSGAPLILLQLIGFLKERYQIIPIIIIQVPGELDLKFNELGKVFYWFKHKPRNIFKKLFIKLSKVFWPNKNIKKIVNSIKKEKIDLIYSNTVINGFIIETIKKQIKSPLITHVHELHGVYYSFLSKKPRISIELSDKIICVSREVRKFYQQKFNINENRFELIHEFAANRKVTGSHDNNLRKELKISEDCFIAMGSGSFELRKGADIFFQIAKSINKNKDINILFIWIGGNPDSLFYKEIQQDINLSNMDNIKIIPHVENPVRFYNIADVFLMTSREDPFPLVNLEFGYLEKPFICFDKSGGSVELADDGCGFVVPYLDIEHYCEKIEFLYKNPLEKIKMGKALQKKVIENYTLETIGEKIYKVIENLVYHVI